MGYGGPHAAFFSTKEEFKRSIPGRIIGISVDAQGNEALRMALQTREQHIRRDKATSNICTAQALLANVAAMYAVYHGPEGLQRIAIRVHTLASALAKGLLEQGFSIVNASRFDTVTVQIDDPSALRTASEAAGLNFRYATGTVGISLDETTTIDDVNDILQVFRAAYSRSNGIDVGQLVGTALSSIPEFLRRKSRYLTHPVFNTYHSEHEMLRFLKRLENKDLSLAHSMIPLGSCTMK
jgi:glycine dehydrogenase